MSLLQINPSDNVSVALTDGECVPRGHKVSLRDIPRGADIIKYGFPIGYATQDIPAGTHVHTHNCKTKLSGELEYIYEPTVSHLSTVQARARMPEQLGTAPLSTKSFPGYPHSDGSVGIRNELWIIPTVGCVNKTAEKLAQAANERFSDLVDGVYAYTHPYGCSQMGDDQLTTQKTLADLVRHPNAAGVLVLGLGCENNNIAVFKDILEHSGGYDPQRVRFLAVQDVEDEYAAGIETLSELATRYTAQRVPVDIGKLVIGLKCGGSDGLSGITANPLVGRISDRLVDVGGSTVLTEVPEMFGAETLLMNRCKDRVIFEQTVSLINDFKDYYTRHNQVIYENPSPGNKAGGITTLEDKSLGCVQKGGTSAVNAVLQTGDRVSQQGLNLLSGPGNDIVACTNLTAAGAHLILFTTGRGTPLGAPVPTVKISTNTELSRRKPHWIDFDAGKLTEGESMDALSDALWEHIIAVASGRAKARNEINGYREIAIFKDGVTL